jgi:hypothetical protein
LAETSLPPEVSTLRIPPDRPLVIVDVDEVVGMFMRGFEAFIGGHGLEMRIDRFALFQNLYRPGEATHVDVSHGRRLFDAFFECDPHPMDVAPGAAAGLAALADEATIVILSNAPAACREARARWLAENGLPYPLVIGAGPKGPTVAALASRTSEATAFVDDLLPNLDSVEAEAPDVHRFQSVADERLRPYAPSAPDHHPRFDSWTDLAPAIARALKLTVHDLAGHGSAGD